MKNIKNLFKKIPKLLLVFFLLLSSLFVMPIDDVQATDYNLSADFQNGWKFTGSTSWGTAAMFKVGGQVGWCLQPGKAHHVGTNSTVTPESIGYSQSQIDRFALIAYYGYRVNPTTTNYFLVQNLIYKELGDPTRIVNASAGYGSESAMTSWFNDVLYQVDHFHDLPSFHNETYEVNVGDTLSIEDTNGALSGLNINGIDGLSIWKEGNTLKVRADSADIADDVSIFFNRGLSIAQTQTNFIVRNGNSQAVSPCLSGSDPYNARVRIHVNKYGKLETSKIDSIGSLVDGAEFRIWNDSINETFTVDKKSEKDLLPGTYYLQEISAPNGYLLDNTVYTITIKTNETFQQAVVNKEPLGQITIHKTNDVGNAVAHAEFRIVANAQIKNKAGTYTYYNAGDVVQTGLVTNASGQVTSAKLHLGSYRVEEVNVPKGYLLNTQAKTVNLTYKDSATDLVYGSTTVVNKEPLGEITLNKLVNANITGGLLGDMYKSGLTYELHAKEDIKNVAGTVTYYKAGALISTKTTDSNGKIKWTGLHMGKYYVVEKKTNDSLLINSTPKDVTLTYKDMHTSVITTSVSMTDVIASQRIHLFKEGIKHGEAGTVQGLKGAEFTFVLESEYQKVGFNKATKYYVGTTNEQGYLTTALLPYGTYRVRETKTPENYYGAPDFILSIKKDSSLYEVGNQMVETVVNNVPFETLLKVQKVDSETGKTVLVPGATYRLKNIDTNEYFSYIDWSSFPNIYIDEWKTHKDGTITLNKELTAGNYQLEETQAPDGYVVNHTPIKFTVKKEMDYDLAEDGKTPIITVRAKDTSTKGIVTIEKRGEVLTDYQDGKFIYEERGLKGAVYEIYAREDIMDPSNDGTVLYKKGELVTTLTTRDDGKVISDELPLGKYYSKEVKAPKGYILDKDKAIQDFELKYEDDKTSLVYEKLTYVNERQKVKVETSKQDEETNEYLAGAKITLKANRDIYNYDGKVIVKADTVIETVTTGKNGKATFTSDLPNDLTPEYSVMPIDEEPSKEDMLDDNNEVDYNYVDGTELYGNTNSLFVVYESQVPDGYTPKKVNYYIDTTYTNQETPLLSFSASFLNKETTTRFEKVTDLNKIIPGTVLEIYDIQENRLVKTLTTTDQQLIVRGLTYGKDYLLKEKVAAIGYVLADDIQFTVGEDEIVKMTDEIVRGKVILEKKGEVLTDYQKGKFIYEERGLKGAIYEIYAKEDILDLKDIGKVLYKKDELVTTLTTDQDGKAISDELPLGKYYSKEVKAPKGYILDKEKAIQDFELKYKDGMTKVVYANVTYQNDRQKVKIEATKQDKETDKYLSGAKITLKANRDIYNYDGEVIVKANTIIETVTTGKDGKATFTSDLPNDLTPEYGTSLLSDSLKDNQIDSDFNVSNDVVSKDEHNDIDSDFSVSTDEAEKDDSMLDDEGYLIDGEEASKNNDEDLDNAFDVDYNYIDGTELYGNTNSLFVVYESEAPKGYNLVKANYYIDTTYTNQETPVLKFDTNFKDERILTDIQVNKIDSETKEVIKDKDFEFTMYVDKECTKAMDTVHANTEDGTATFKDVKSNQTVYIKETKAPNGYKLSSEVKEVILDERLNGFGSIYRFEYGNEKEKKVLGKKIVKSEKVSTNDGNIIITYVFILVGIICLFGIVVLRKKRT